MSFSVAYQGSFSGPKQVVEHYLLTPQQVEQTVELPGYAGPIRITFPLLEDLADGTKTTITTNDKTTRVTLGDQTQTFTAAGASSITVDEQHYPSRTAGRTSASRSLRRARQRN